MIIFIILLFRLKSFQVIYLCTCSFNVHIGVTSINHRSQVEDVYLNMIITSLLVKSFKYLFSTIDMLGHDISFRDTFDLGIS